jgi:hypothetical protein
MDVRQNFGNQALFNHSSRKNQSVANALASDN